MRACRKNQYDGVEEFYVTVKETVSRKQQHTQEEINRKIGKAIQLYHIQGVWFWHILTLSALFTAPPVSSLVFPLPQADKEPAIDPNAFDGLNNAAKRSDAEKDYVGSVPGNQPSEALSSVCGFATITF